MKYPITPLHACPHCGWKFFTPYSLSAHIAKDHYVSPAERAERTERYNRHSSLAKESRKRNETPDWTEE